MKPAIPPTSNPANTDNPIENGGIFHIVLGVGGVSGLEGHQPDLWNGKLPPKRGQTLPAKAGLALSALSAPIAPLVPLDQPFVDGQRYREAGALELATRLDLFVADPVGPWIRRYGVLLSA